MSSTTTTKTTSTKTTALTLDDVPRHVLVHSILLAHCTGADIRALTSTCRRWWNGMEHDDDLWKSLYESRGVRFPRCPPRFPSCGTWRDVYLRSIKFQSLVIVRTLTRPKEELRLVLSRSTPLYGLKKEVRERQRQLDGVALEDFELRDYGSKLRLGIAGNDSLPPADLRRLFWMDMSHHPHQQLLQQQNIVAGHLGLHNGGGGLPRAATFGRAGLGGMGVDGWRSNLTSISDGAVFEQVFVSTLATQASPSSQLQSFETKMLEMMPDADAVSLLLDESSREMTGAGPLAFKTFWRKGWFHPLIELAMDSGLPPTKRLTALYLFLRQFARTLFRFRFLSDVLVQAVLRSGFPLAFARLSMEIFPMVWQTQIKQMLEADFDFGFALRLVRDVFKATRNAFWPVVRSASLVELGRVLMRLTWIWESPREGMVVNLALLTREVFANRQDLVARLVGPEADVLSSVEAIASFGFKSHTFTYALSSFLWHFFERRTESALSVTLPLYFYALPVIACAVVLRARVFLAQSYVSLLLA